MAKEINTQTIVFNPAAKTLNFSAWTSFDIRKLVSVINDDKNTEIYAIGDDEGRGLASFSGTTLTLQFDTTSHSAGDRLTAIYDDKQIVSVDSLPAGLATSALQTSGNASLNSLDSKITSISVIPPSNQSSIPIRVVPQNITRTTFANAISNGVDTTFWNLLITGSGMSVNQTGGNLVITSGTTANSETIIRSKESFYGNLNLRWSTILSQRIANNNFFIELVDLIGDNLAYTINSATSISITIPSNPFTSANIGQSMLLQNIQGTAGTISGRYAIASVAGNVVQFTVAGFPVSGSGTLSLVGWNYIRALYTGTTATSLTFETQRRGYNSGSSFVATINTTASPGHLCDISDSDNNISLSDSLQAAAAALNMTRRAETIQSLPSSDTQLFLQIRVLNGSTAPASTTTWTLGMMSVASRSIQNVEINSIANFSQNSQLPVNIINTSIPVAGVAGHSAASSGNPVRAGGRVNTTADTTLVAGDTSDLFMSTAGQLIIKPYATSELDWQYTATLTTNTATAMTAAGAASVRNYLTGLVYQNTSATATTILILDGATTIATFQANASMAMPAVITFPTPLRGTAATALNINCGTTGANVIVSSQGYKSF